MTRIFSTIPVNLNFHVKMNPGLSLYSRLKMNSHFTTCISFINVYSKKCILIQRYTLHSHDRLFQEIWQMGFTIFPHSPKKVLKYRVSQIEMCCQVKMTFQYETPCNITKLMGDLSSNFFIPFFLFLLYTFREELVWPQLWSFEKKS